ncbi:MAG: tyrosine-type recombinase/integrase [Treponema sp.]|nr:tyrosine-type recombinase/integrase [Treponema sp.]
MREPLPFILYKRKSSRFYYVMFKLENGPGYTSGRSTGEENRTKAFRKACQMLSGPAIKAQEMSADVRRLVSRRDLTRTDAEALLSGLEARGLVRSYVLPGDGADIVAVDYALDFWTRGKSRYLAEQVRAGKTPGTQVLDAHRSAIRRHWAEVLGGKLLADVTKADLDRALDRLSGLALSFHSKNKIMEAMTKPLGYAYREGLMREDLSRRWVRFKGSYRKREVFPPEIKDALFRREWKDGRAKLAFMLSMTTGMRCGEILALRGEDLDMEKGRIHVRHSWSAKDGLKSTKNGDERTAVCPIPSLMAALARQLELNPHGGENRFVFWGRLPEKPIDGKTFLDAMREELARLGLSREEAARYEFHSCRHDFITTMVHGGARMSAVQGSVGHKTKEMTEHYSEHVREEELDALGRDVAGLYGAYFLPKVV